LQARFQDLLNRLLRWSARRGDGMLLEDSAASRDEGVRGFGAADIDRQERL